MLLNAMMSIIVWWVHEILVLCITNPCILLVFNHNFLYFSAMLGFLCLNVHVNKFWDRKRQNWCNSERNEYKRIILEKSMASSLVYLGRTRHWIEESKVHSLQALLSCNYGCKRDRKWAITGPSWSVLLVLCWGSFFFIELLKDCFHWLSHARYALSLSFNQSNNKLSTIFQIRGWITCQLSTYIIKIKILIWTRTCQDSLCNGWILKLI